MLYACVQKFDVTGTAQPFLKLNAATYAPIQCRVSTALSISKCRLFLSFKIYYNIYYTSRYIYYISRYITKIMHLALLQKKY